MILGKNILGRLARLCAARPKTVLSLWGIVGVGLFIVGLNGADSLRGSDILIKGTPSSKAVDLERSHFGETQNLAVLLKGSPKEIERFGPKAAKRLDRIANVDVLSPWSENAPELLRPKKSQALLVLQVGEPFDVAGKETAPAVRRALDKALPASVTAHVTGTAELAAEMNRIGYKSSKKSELLALPILIIILLLVFRSPVAALLPALLGFAVVVCGDGLIALLSRLTGLDAMATAMMSMMGLALGTDYSLLVVSRLREELAAGHATPEAVERTARTAGRTVMFSGTVLMLGMLAALVIAPGGIMTSATIGSLAAATLAITGSATLLPALSSMLAPHLDRWRVGRSSPRFRIADIIKRVIRRPGIATAAVLLPLLALTVPASALTIGALSPTALPEGNLIRKDFEEIGKQAGGGWVAIFNVIAVSNTGPITEKKRLRQLDRFQKKVARQKGVNAVLGPAALNRRSKELRRASKELSSGRKQIEKAERAAADAKGGVGDLKSGLAVASSGAESLAQGLSRSSDGAFGLESALSESASGSRKISDAVSAARGGAKKIAAAADNVEEGTALVKDSSADFTTELKGSQASLDGLRSAAADATAQLKQALTTLDETNAATKSDPKFASAYQTVATALGTISGEHPKSGQRLQSSYAGFEKSISRASEQNLIASKQAGRTEVGVSKLHKGVDELRGGIGSLEGGLKRIYSGSNSLTEGLVSTREGAGALGSGNKELQAGAGTLVQGLEGGMKESGGLEKGLDRISGQLKPSSTQGTGQGIPTDSGYFVLAGIDSGDKSQRKDATFALNVDRGGTASRIMVVPDWVSPEGKRADAGPEVIASLDRLDGRLRKTAGNLGKKIGADTAISGRGPVLTDYVSTVNGRIVPLLMMLITVALVVLTVVFRSPLLAVKAVILNLLTVGAAFGVFVLAASGDSSLIGGSDYLEPFSVFAILAIMFALSIDYEVFLITRMREGYLKTGSTDDAIVYGIDHTARVITGAAAIMIGVFFVFSISDYMIIRQLGFGLGVAVFLDAIVVRLVLLPATMRLFGRANWWMPKWLDRLIPDISVEGEGT